MKIKKLEYKDEEFQWQLNPMEFSSTLNLLVGISGAGKTQILQAIYNLKKIANGGSLNGVDWDITFSTQNNTEYHWRGKFQTRENNLTIKDGASDENEFVILYEYLDKDDKSIIKRTKQEGIIFNDRHTPKLSPFTSIIELLSQEEDISQAQKEFDNIIKTESTNYFIENGAFRFPTRISRQYENCDLLKIKNSGLPTPIKLALVYRYSPTTFNKIKEIFTEIFHKVENIKIEPFNQDELPLDFADLAKELILIKVKEKNVETWIRQDNLSSGMYKTLMYISELYLAPDESIILIDEFENSLGVNCIDSVTDLICDNRNSQFIITSHHPYIINNISPKYWKIVTRQGGSVTVKKAEDFHISESRQKAFIDLINILEDEEDMEDR